MALSFNQDRKSINFVITQLCDNHNLSAWEHDFISSIKKQFIDEGKFLSKKQEEKLSDLWEKY